MHHWGAGLAAVKDGHLEDVLPHPSDPDPSRINENIVDGIYGRARILRPAIRKSYLENGPGSRRETRGEEIFIEVDYDTALDLVAKEINRVRINFGNQSIFAGSYGWASAGRFHHAQSQLKRFLNCAGGFVRSEGNYSYHAALVLMPHIVGNFREHVRQATRWSAVAKSGRLVVMFGGVPLRNTQISGGGVARHCVAEELLKCKKTGVQFINLSPIQSDSMGQLEAEWLPPKPGTDTALMLGLAHSLLIENLHDQAFLDRYCVGFEKVADYLMGQSGGVVRDADWAAKLCGIDAKRIRQLAREMAKQRTLITTAASLQRAKFGDQPLWMTVTLAAMLGQIGLPGGGYGIGYGADASIGTNDRPYRWPSFPQGDNPIDEYIPVACISDMLLNPGAEYDYNGEVKRYPDIRMVWWAGGNPFHHHQDLNRLQQAFRQPDTIIVNEINWTSTARHADIVLPVASAMERNDFGAGSQDNAIIPMPAAISPVGDSREEYKIYCELEKRLELESGFSLGRTTDQWLEVMWAEMCEAVLESKIEMPDFALFMAGDVIQFKDPDPHAVFLSSFRHDPHQNPLTTPSGKIELWSEVIDSFGYDDCPGQASWLEADAEDELSSGGKYPLQLISGQPETRLHSQYDNGAYSRSKKIQGREPVMIHPKDANSRGIREGDIVQLSNMLGSCLAGAVITETINMGNVFLWTGAWFDPDRNEAHQRDNHGNPNVLTRDHRTSRLSQGPAVDSRVELQKFDGVLPSIHIFEPPL
ncbi:MAG: biotin/methionine sulfoxide reductase [Gammaproteobacteria bacterium]|jgi:biotin/methionine sulfoxide reductase